jgi:S1-C subfamily serine protease
VGAVNDKPVLGIRDLLDQITLHRPDEQIQVTLYRGSENLTVDMKVTQRRNKKRILSRILLRSFRDNIPGG